MELDTSPFHTVQSYQGNGSRLAFQSLFPRLSNKQSWIFDSGGMGPLSSDARDLGFPANGPGHSLYNASLVEITLQTDTAKSQDLPNLDSDSRGFDGRESFESISEGLNNLVKTITRTVCEYLDFDKSDSDNCRLRFGCRDNDNHIINKECLRPQLYRCDATYQNEQESYPLKTFEVYVSSSARENLCLTCATDSSFGDQIFELTKSSRHLKWTGDAALMLNDTGCSGRKCLWDVPCHEFNNETEEHLLPTVSGRDYEEYNNYTINRLLSPYYSNITSYFFGDHKTQPSDAPSVNRTTLEPENPTHFLLPSSWLSNTNTTSNLSQPINYSTVYSNVNLFDILGNWSRSTWSEDFTHPVDAFPDMSSSADVNWNSADVLGVPLEDGPAQYDFSFLFLTVFILVGGGGNILVCLSICLEKRLHNVTNYFLMSLAVADLLVSLVVMPFGAIAGFLGYWPFGLVWCNIYISCDVLACTSSIMHMCTISLGRYMGIRNPLKTRNNSKKIVGMKVVLVWCSAMLVTSLITVLGIVDPLNIMPQPQLCAINNRAFFFVGSVCAFFVPMVIMVISYGLTVHLLRKKAKFAGDAPAGKARTMGRYRSVKRKTKINSRPPPRQYPYDDRLDLPRSYSNGSGLYSISGSVDGEPEVQTPESIERETRNFKLKALRLQLVGTAAWHLRFLATKKRDALAANAVATEQKASKVLGLVFFAFLICWTPFFLLTVYMAACPGCPVPDQLANMVLWLGYVSSTINPVIYTAFNRTFRSAFVSLLRCRYTFSNRPIRSFSASENIAMYGGGPILHAASSAMYGGGPLSHACPSTMYSGGGLSRAPPPQSASAHTLSSYVRSPSFQSPLVTAAGPSIHEHRL